MLQRLGVILRHESFCLQSKCLTEIVLSVMVVMCHAGAQADVVGLCTGNGQYSIAKNTIIDKHRA